MYPGFEGDSVMRMAPDGTVTSMALPPIIWPVMTTQDGRLFAALLLENDIIVELDPDFEAPPREVVSDGNFIHMREGPDDMIYAIRWFDGEIVRFDPDAPDKVETVATGLTLPFNLAFDSKGQLYIITGIDESTDAVARLDLETGEPEVLVTMNNLLYGLAIDSKDRIFVSSLDDGTIFEVLPESDIRIVSPGGMILPGDVEVIARPDGESLFLADWGAWREYDTATGELRSTRHGTWWPGTLTNPDTIAPFGDYLLLASSENQQIQIWDPMQQQEVLLIDDPGVNNAIGFDDAIVATSHETKDVVRIDPKDPDQRTVLAGGLEYPLGLAVDAGNLYVGDFLAGQILQITADGGTLDPPKLIAEGLQGPEGLALTGDGRLLVVESGANRLSLVDLSSGEVTPLATSLGIMRDVPRSRPLHYFFNGVDVSPSGMVYVTADDANAIYRIPLPKPTSKLDDATAAKIETLVAEIMTNGQVPGAAVGIVKDGELVYAKGFGVTELGSDEPVTADTIFHMGSVAKTATAVAIMQLVEAGKIDLDAPVTEYLSDFTLADPDLGEVTIRRLLSHTAGIPDPIDWLAEYQDENLRSDDAALDDYVRSLGDQSMTYQPGEDWAYSNTGFDVLGDVVATVSGQSYEDYLQANVLTPLGMANSSYLLSDLDPAKLAAPHMYDEDGNAKTLDFYPYTRAHAPSGAFYSSIHDMARFAIANLNQGELDGTRVLPASAYEEMWAPQAASPWAEMFGPQVASYGLGWWVGDFNDHRIIGNYGTEFGFQSHMALFPDDGMAVIALVNLFDPEAGQFYALQIGDAVEAELLGVEVPAQ
jgi:CubicO group peptidase (beta-lactamase class C family)